MALKFDQIGIWSEVKLAIIRDYSQEYSKILSAQRNPPFHHVYVDGFSGPGEHIAKRTGEFVRGSPLNALAVAPPFKEHFLVDLDGDKVEHLRGLVGDRPDVHILCGDCNRVLLDDVFPNVRYDQYRRGLCLLDPYGLTLNWGVIAAAGVSGSMDIFLNFPVMDMNRNAIWRDPSGVDPDGVARMTTFWGDESWRGIAYPPARQGDLFNPDASEKASNEVIAEAFRQRLKEVAGFKYVLKPMPMRNSTRAVVYYLMFASHKNVAGKIVRHIFDKYQAEGA